MILFAFYPLSSEQLYLDSLYASLEKYGGRNVDSTISLFPKKTSQNWVFWQKCKSCQRPANCKRHEKTQHLKIERKEVCDFCDFASKDRASLVYHIRKEHLELDEITGLDAPCISGKDPLKESPKKGRASISIEDMIEGKNFSHFPSISVHFHTCSGRP